jgi:hypothetical protein
MGKRGSKSSVRIDGHDYFGAGVMTSKHEAVKEAKRIRSKGRSARVRKYKAGYQVYGR